LLDLLTVRVSSTTQADIRVARSTRSTLVLLLCVIVLAAAVDLEFTTNDPLLLERMLSWAEDDAYDDSHATADGDAAINEKFSVRPLESDSGMRTLRPEIHSASIVISLGTRAPPLFGGMGQHPLVSPLVSFKSTRHSLDGCTSCPRLVSAALPNCVLMSEAKLFLATSNQSNAVADLKGEGRQRCADVGRGSLWTAPLSMNC